MTEIVIQTPPPVLHQSTAANLDEVRDFWNSQPCGVAFVDLPFGTPEFYEAYRAFRYRTEWHLNRLVPFEEFRGQSVLEIGCGLGADGARFAQAGAHYTGIDLTPAAVEATRLHFEALGLQGRLLVQDAERMVDLADHSFDLVYSHGVLHHTPSLEGAFREICRVLKPGGRIILMLYNKRSFNYYVRILGLMRLQLLCYAGIRALLPANYRRGRSESHYRNLTRLGWSYLSNKEFPHHCTDGPECPIAYCYTKKELTRRLSPMFSGLRFQVAHFPLRKTMRWIPLSVEQVLAKRFGWYTFVYGTRF